MNSLAATFGNIDIYLFDQLLKGTFDDCKYVLDIGCGNGRNLVYFLKNNFNVFGIDKDEEAIEVVKNLSQQLSVDNNIDNFKVGLVEELPFPPQYFDLVISSAVFHFAQDEKHFDAMVRSAWSVLKPGGFLFARLASNIGIEALVLPLGKGRYLLPDGSERFLVDQKLLLNYSKDLNGQLIRTY